MPINDPKALRDTLQRAFADGVFSPSESARVLAELGSNGVSESQAKVVVESFKAAMQSGSGAPALDVQSPRRRDVVNKFLAEIDAKRSLPLDKASAPKNAHGVVDFVTLLTRPNMPIPGGRALASFTGKDLGVTRSGELTLGGTAVALAMATPSADALDALWALNVPGQLESLSEPVRAALGKRLAAVLAEAVAVDPKSPNKFDRLAAMTATAGALMQLPKTLRPQDVDAVLAALPKLATPLAKALLLATLDGAALSTAQKKARAALPAVEEGAGLLATYEALRAGKQELGGGVAQGPLAQLGLSALAFGRTPAALENFGKAVSAWRELNADATTLDDDELALVRQSLTTYIDTTDSAVFLYGIFAEQARKDVANVRNARLVAELSLGLAAASPTLAGYPLTRAQADVLKSVLGTARDAKAVLQLKTCMNLTAAAFCGRIGEGQTSAAPAQAMSAAAFDYLERALRTYARKAESSPDGKLGFDDLARELQRDAGALSADLATKLSSLAAKPARWGDIELSAAAAAGLRQTLETNLRSPMTLLNLERAVRVMATASGGALVGAAGDKLAALLVDYRAFYPGLTFLDFNKLERLAKCKIEGRPYPVFSVNGAPIGMAALYEAVAKAVCVGVDRGSLDYPWMADRWGQRAKVAVELVDVVAEQAARGEGPIALLRSRYPGKSIEVLVTGRDGDHEQFVYVVKDGATVVDYFTQGSDGTVARYARATTPVIFRAAVDAEGGLAIAMDKPLALKRWPMQQTYGVGDSIDYPYYDAAAKEIETEGEDFSTRYKILEAKIKGFSAAGKYTVEYKLPDGTPRTSELDLSEIRKANNPHYFALNGSVFSDVSIDAQKDKPLREFLDGAKPIIAEYLPTDGSLATLAPAELALRQRDCLTALQAYTAERMKYPAEEKESPDEASKKYHALVAGAGEWNPVPLGKLLELQRGVCRHQCIVEQLLCELAGIDSRLASGAANEDDLDFRGFHIWQEVTLADNQRYLSDQTWSDVAVPLWTAAYGVDARRIEMSDRTARYDDSILLPS